MSQQLVSQVIKKTCEGCGQEKKYELVDAGEETIREMQDWYAIVREVWVGDRFQKIISQACCLACVPLAAVKLALPVTQEPDALDGINLDSLRAKNIRPN